MRMLQRAWILTAALAAGPLAVPAAAQFGVPAPAYDQGRLSRSAVFLFGTPVAVRPFGYAWPPPPWGVPFGLSVLSAADLEYRPLSAATGNDTHPAPADLANVVVRRADAPAIDEDEPPAPRKIRAANSAAMARARQFIEYGDARFQQQEFSEAYQRYRKAADAAPNLADAYFRQAFAQSALGRYMPAVKSIRRGLALQPDWPKADFELDLLYQGNRAAKQMHFERLASAAEKEPDDADKMFLLGVELFFDRQSDRAHTFIQAAGDLGLDGELVRGFIEAAAPQSKRRTGGEEL